jgi:hypothetical protein
MWTGSRFFLKRKSFSEDSIIGQLLLVLHRRAMMVGNLECLGFYSAHVTHPCPQLKISSVDSASNKAVTIIFNNDFTLDGDRVNGADLTWSIFWSKEGCYVLH